MIDVIGFLTGDARAERTVPRTGVAARLTWFTAAAMAFLAVFALALSLATGHLAERWSETLARSSTVRISAPPDQIEAQTRATLAVLTTTPGVAEARPLADEEQLALLRPWFGPDLPLETLPLPRLVEVIESAEGYDAEGLRLRLAAEAPGAVLDDHLRWRRPLMQAANRIRALGLFSLCLILATTAAMITLAANASLSANRQVLEVLRLVGARDIYIVRAFVRRFMLRALGGASIGTGLAVLAVALLPAETPGGLLTGLSLIGADWLWPLAIPPLAAMVAYFATRIAAFRALRSLR